MRENLGRKHRRIAAAEHAVEERMKEVAATRPDELADPEGMEEAADAISEHADRHEDIAARIEDV